MSDPERRARWNERWTRRDYADTEPAAVVHDYAYLLPPGGEVLEVACGLGVNALHLAAAGFRVTAWDYAETAIARLEEEARSRELVLTAEVRDVVAAPPAPASFDAIIVTRFLERELCPALAAALRPGGVLCYQSFVRDAASDRGPQDAAFRFAPNELLRLFPDLRVLVFHDEGRAGDTAQGFRDESLLVAQRAE
jgi:SAM-dependent methyltransferase